MNLKKAAIGFLLLFVLLFTACNKETEPQTPPEIGVTEQRFLLESDGYALNAVYTYAGEPGPAVLLIAGSGPSDEDETIGALAPLADIAGGLAERGISSLRVEKRTFRYADSFAGDAGIEEEYLVDCRSALSWLREQSGTRSVYLLGHSQGGQIAAVIAASDPEISGMVIWNSSARHMADISCDQLAQYDPVNRSKYEKYAAVAKAVTPDSAKGYYYFGANDYYWVSYNKINVIDSIVKARIPTLIINSTYDSQMFDADISLWQETLGNADHVSIKIYNDQSHFGYKIKIDTANQSVLYTKQDFPEELIDDFSSFCK